MGLGGEGPVYCVLSLQEPLKRNQLRITWSNCDLESPVWLLQGTYIIAKCSQVTFVIIQVRSELRLV